MRQRWLATVVVGLVWTGTAVAQEPNWQFRWHKGQVMSYKAEHKTNVEEVAEGSKIVAGSKLTVIKLWEVVDVDAEGAATLRMSLAAMRNEQTRPSGEVLLFDTADPASSNLDIRNQMSKFIGQTLAVLRMDIHGRILEVKQGTASRFEAEPPFVLVFPAAAPKEGQIWHRSFKVALDAPLGAGEQLEAVQRCQCTKIAGTRATLTVANQFKALPESAKDQVPLIQKMSEGEVIFDIQAGQVIEVQLNIDRSLANHRGEGSSYHFQSAYTEQLVNVK